MQAHSLQVRCPTCQKRGTWLALATAPFCYRRCQLLDLGQWFDEEQKISEPLSTVDAAPPSEANTTVPPPAPDL